MKTCSKCKKKISLSDFYKRKESKDGLNSQCKLCIDKYNRNYNGINIDKISEYKKEYYLINQVATKNRSNNYYNKNKLFICEKNRYRYNLPENREFMLNKSSRYRENNRKKLNNNQKEYYRKNKEKVNNYQKIYRKNNLYNIRRYRRKYMKGRYDNDSIFRLKSNIGGLLYKALCKIGCDKNLKIVEILGCSTHELIHHLNDNKYGFVFGDRYFDIDHIIPLSSAMNEEDVYKLNNYSNLQLLPSYYNQHIKIDKEFDVIGFENWLID